MNKVLSVNKIKSIGKNGLKFLQNKLSKNFILTIGCFVLIGSGCTDINSGKDTSLINNARMLAQNWDVNAHNTSKLLNAVGFTKIGVGLILLGKKE